MKGRHALTLILIAALLLSPLKAYAEQCVGVAPLKLGASAPCAGLLWPESYSRTALSCLKVDIPKLEAFIEKLEAEHKAELKALNSKLFATEEALIESEDRLREASAVDREPWYRSPYLWTSVGLVVGVGLTIGAVKLAGELR